MEKKQLNYQETERKRAVDLLKTTSLFNGAETGGIIHGKPRDFALKDWKQNLWDKIRDDSITYFDKNGIDWHIFARQGHILSSQVCCINHLFPIRHDKENVLRLAKAVCNEFIDVLPINTDEYSPGYIQFEAVSDIDHFNEGKPTRGSNCTSVDALIYAVHKDGKKHMIPIEWKYTENYNDEDKSIEDRQGEPKGNELRGKERLKRYSKLIDDSRFLKKMTSYKNSIYFFEPFYQLMRQTLWAEQMIQHREEERIKAVDYIHLHIIPNENDELLYKMYKISKKPLRESWLDNLNDKGKYIIISPMDFIKNIDNNKYNDLLNYLQKRYCGGKAEYILNRHCNIEHQDNNVFGGRKVVTKYNINCFDEFDDLSSIGMDFGELFMKLNESCQYGQQGLFAPEVLASENEIVCIVDFACTRNATAYAVFFDKKTNKITRKMPYRVFLKIYDSLLESGYLNIAGNYWNILKDGVFKLD